MQKMRFSYNENRPLEGILWHLYKNKKIPFSKTVFTSATSELSGSLASKFAVDFNKVTYWHAAANKEVGEYITISIIYPISLTGYAIQTSTSKPNHCHPRHWAFSVSKDGMSYVNSTAYDDENGYMNNNSRIIHIPYQSQEVRFFRVNITGPSYCGLNRMDVAQVELFGTIEIFKGKTCVQKPSWNHNFFIFFLSICYLKS